MHLPDELLLEILSYMPRGAQSQSTLASFCLVSRQWYDVGIRRLYDSPYLEGKHFELFVRTICPSINAHIRKSELAGLVKMLDLSHIVHQGNKAITARLLGRTKNNLEVFIAPQASFAINCWAALSKCTKLQILNLTLVSECISYQALNQTVRQLPELTEIYLPRCSNGYDGGSMSMNVKWPPMLRHLQLSGHVHEKFLGDINRQPNSFPPTMTSLSISHCPRLGAADVQNLLRNLSNKLLHVELRDLPYVKQGRLNNVMEWVPDLKSLTIAIDYIDVNFGSMPQGFSPDMWEHAKPLESLTLVTSGSRDVDGQTSFMPVDLFELMDQRFLGRLRYIAVAKSTGWQREEEGAEVDALELLLEQLDQENWQKRRWHYKGLEVPVDCGIGYRFWCQTAQGKMMRSRLRMLRQQ
ncbi:uncharacterized protein BDR25DRAFT_327483 [Lindgomyces ingoldianus]|uniref:Uncharacterized protein n=1 Tax=Lindgomyces ingoldianus TaxID=673940 RepID=A0ACB6QKX7_9PLEO|nr:uncharacterized protein BDR25DRAFT_327483 [Lindgomyces ingoldianus]KAF2467228.1 hypothetical protein BDR25DRAFT_327483 [Lindgomyces ingoldianus]